MIVTLQLSVFVLIFIIVLLLRSCWLLFLEAGMTMAMIVRFFF
jgi:hypothetical protein